MTKEEAVDLLATCLNYRMLGKSIARIQEMARDQFQLGASGGFTKEGAEEWRRLKDLASKLLDAIGNVEISCQHEAEIEPEIEPEITQRLRSLDERLQHVEARLLIRRHEAGEKKP